MKKTLKDYFKDIPLWKKIYLGLFENIIDIKNKLIEKKIRFVGNQAMFDDNIFFIETEKHHLKLYKIKVSDLELSEGYLYGSNYEKIVLLAKIYGLGLCPRETAFLLALQSKKLKNENFSVMIATEAIRLPINKSDFSNGFRRMGYLLKLINKGNQIEIHLVDINSTFTNDTEIIFCKK